MVCELAFKAKRLDYDFIHLLSQTEASKRFHWTRIRDSLWSNEKRTDIMMMRAQRLCFWVALTMSSGRYIQVLVTRLEQERDSLGVRP